MLKKMLLVLLPICIFLLTGCQKKALENPPTKLNSIESNAEDVMDDITGDDWAAAQTRVYTIKSDYANLKPIMKSSKISTKTIEGLNTAINNLETAVSKKKSYDSRVQANQILKYIPDIADSYATTIPTDIGRLDYLGRELVLNAENSDWSSASNNYETTNKLWKNVSSKLSSNYKNDIDSFQNNMVSLKDAIDKKDTVLTTTQANALLENVDVLEVDFTNTK